MKAGNSRFGRSLVPDRKPSLVVSFDPEPLARMEGAQALTKSPIYFVVGEKFLQHRVIHNRSLQRFDWPSEPRSLERPDKLLLIISFCRRRRPHALHAQKRIRSMGCGCRLGCGQAQHRPQLGKEHGVVRVLAPLPSGDEHLDGRPFAARRPSRLVVRRHRHGGTIWWGLCDAIRHCDASVIRCFLSSARVMPRRCAALSAQGFRLEKQTVCVSMLWSLQRARFTPCRRVSPGHDFNPKKREPSAGARR